ncbi:hypothetical protein BKH43_00265 [Helicobacter sp. 13S00401-1]|uniref:hypothetical protein n=1 Tax=Helicobacter sp. 13S00401-1 TaxID=1905758 RepID=UPI000BA6B111|nr:hypothetical protein [Helicobacter sp. 13S00401-1]PAF51711.1 hypothetical protein BKH43_00265 [Helicobacter sp. 13S00401-1]
MGNRVLIGLSFIILLVSLSGLLVSTNTQARSESEALAKDKVRMVSVLALTRDMKEGELIESSDLQTKSIEYDFSTLKDAILDRPASYAANSILKGNFAKDYILHYDDIYKPKVASTNLPSGKLAFLFPLYEREYRMLGNIDSGDKVDVYFRYETKAPRKETGIVSKKEEGVNFQSKEEANNTNLALMFANKSVQYIKHSATTEQLAVSGQHIVLPKGYISIALDPKEIQKVYAVESLGNFYFFPASSSNPGKTISASEKYYSTQQVLSKDFIKEIRGE